MIRSVRAIIGQVDLHPQVEGEGIAPRDVVVWTPPGYDAAAGRRYPVLYMQDGKNLFGMELERENVDWHVDETCATLIRDGEIEPLVVVGIYNTENRMAEYAPGTVGAAYRRFVIEQLKPFVDARYPTLPGREHTFAGGSSMGGLVSFIFVWAHTDVFSRAICMSPAFRHDRIDVDYVRVVQADLAPRRDAFIYVDNGGIGLEAELQPGIDAMLAALEQKGYRRGRDFVWVNEPDAPHFETAWARRLPAALRVCLSREGPTLQA